jgi:hypothetical protein
MSIDIKALFDFLNDFCKLYPSSINSHAFFCNKKHQWAEYLPLSEMLFIEALFHLSPYKDFKHHYLYGICIGHRMKFSPPPTAHPPFLYVNIKPKDDN